MAERQAAVERKSRGAFFTPPALCDYVVEWAVRTGSDRVLEPSCGEAAFLQTAATRLVGLSPDPNKQAFVLDGYELDEASAAIARDIVAELGVTANVWVGDFFIVEPTANYDVVIGNPPYVRYQDFAGETRARSREAALRAGVPLSQLASSWAAFTVHSSLFLREGGRLGLVLPAELLSVNYASAVRKYLLERFEEIQLVLFNERVFPGVQEEVVLLLADGYCQGPAAHFKVFQAANEHDLAEIVSTSWFPEDPGAKWTPSLLDPGAARVLVAAERSNLVQTLADWGSTTLGMVTGNNKYFCLSETQRSEWGIPTTDLLRISPPGSSHLRGLAFSQAAWTEMKHRDKPVWLFRPPEDPSPASQVYIDAGEELGVHQAYKCRVRRPWWRVPLVKAPDLFLTYMNADFPRLCVNVSKVHHLNSVHGFYLSSCDAIQVADVLPLVMLNSLSLLGAEVYGRSYGGGMLKIEPREADRLPLPSVQLVTNAAERLHAVAPTIGAHLRNYRLAEAVCIVDDLLLVEHGGMSRADVRVLRDAHQALRSRRDARSGR